MKKVLWIILLIAVISGVVVLMGVLDDNKNNPANSTNTAFKKDSSISNEVITEKNENNSKEYIKTELSDGTLYSIDGKEYKSDIVVGDNYYDTTINDMYLNPDSYYNKNIEIEGMYFENSPYTFVGRYSTSNMCPNCPSGYSYIEYQLDGKLDKKLTDVEDWIKIIGTLTKGNDESSYYQDYYYLKVLSIEVMKERGQETVNN